MDTKKICPKCSKEVEDGATICPNCGHLLTMEQPKPQKPTVSTSIMMSNQMPDTMVVDGKAMPTASHHPESGTEKKSLIALVVSVIALPFSLIPIVGILLGLAGLSIGINARLSYKHIFNLLAIIFSVVAIILSIVIWVNKPSNAPNPYTQKGPYILISNRCFSVKVDTGLKHYRHRGCSFSSSDKNEQFEVVAVVNKNVTTSNLTHYGIKSLAAGAVKSDGKLSDGHLGTFAGSPAYFADFKSSKADNSAVFAYVLHPTASGYNVFIVGRAVVGGGLDSFGSLKSTWQWK